MALSLGDLIVGEKARILGFKPGNAAYCQRLLSMGLVPDAEFTLVRVAPLGDPIEVRINNHSLCLRKREGAILEIERFV